jgi:hypothetical protein
MSDKKPEKVIKIECGVCRLWKNPDGTWENTSPEERRKFHYFSAHNKVSHGLCPECLLEFAKTQGVTEAELKKHFCSNS